MFHKIVPLYITTLNYFQQIEREWTQSTIYPLIPAQILKNPNGRYLMRFFSWFPSFLAQFLKKGANIFEVRRTLSDITNDSLLINDQGKLFFKCLLSWQSFAHFVNHVIKSVIIWEMMVRTQIQRTEEQVKAVRKIAILVSSARVSRRHTPSCKYWICYLGDTPIRGLSTSLCIKTEPQSKWTRALTKRRQPSDHQKNRLKLIRANAG